MTDDPVLPRPANPAYGDGYFVRTTRFRQLPTGSNSFEKASG